MNDARMSFPTRGLEPNKAAALNKVFNAPMTDVSAIEINIHAKATGFGIFGNIIRASAKGAEEN